MKRLFSSDSKIAYSYYLPAQAKSSQKNQQQLHNPQAKMRNLGCKPHHQSSLMREDNQQVNNISKERKDMISSNPCLFIGLAVVIIFVVGLAFSNNSETNEDLLSQVNLCYVQYARSECDIHPLADNCAALTECILYKKIPASITSSLSRQRSLLNEIFILLTPVIGFITKILLELYASAKQKTKQNK